MLLADSGQSTLAESEFRKMAGAQIMGTYEGRQLVRHIQNAVKASESGGPA